MKVAVFSDTHTNTARMLEAVRQTMPDAIIHLGDHVRDTQCLQQEFPEIPLYSVRGNCDFTSGAPDKAVVQLGTVKAFLTHGHLWNESRLPPIGMGTVLVHGHTHVPEQKKLACGVTIFNPGSVSLPKGGSSCGFGYFDGSALTRYCV